jgi:hypothetical protein
MTSDDPLLANVHELATAHLEDRLSETQFGEFCDRICNDPAFALQYVRYMQDCANLQWAFGEVELARRPIMRSDSAPSAGLSGHLFNKNLHMWPVAAAIAFFGTLFLFVGGLGSSRPDGDKAFVAESVSRAVGIVSRLDNAHWLASDATLAPLDRVSVGQSLALESGVVEVTFDCGVQVRIKGPSDFVITSDRSARCNQGMVTTEVGEQGRGFSIETPAAKVVDLGTRFGLGVDEGGGTEVVVFDGIVDLTSSQPPTNRPRGEPTRLIQGEAVRIDSTGDFRRLVSINTSQFPLPQQAVAGSMGGPATILDVYDNIRDSDSRKFYQITTRGFGEDTRAFVDRPHQWNGVDESGLPVELRGADYILPFNDDKFVENLEVVVTLRCSAVLYVLLSDRVAPPDWLRESFQLTDLSVGLDEGLTRYKKLAVSQGPGASIDTRFTVWKRVVESAGSVTLGALKRPDMVDGFNMYGILATPLDEGL